MEANANDKHATCDDEATHYFIDAFKKLDPKDRIGILFSFILVIVGALQYVVYTRQADIMESQARPWVGFQGVLIGPLAVGKKLSLIGVIKNSGNTPAEQVEICAASGKQNSSQLDVASIKKMMTGLDRCPITATVFLLPNTQVTVDISRKAESMTQQVVDDVRANRTTLAVFGRISYKSATDGAVHWSSFCALYMGIANSFNACMYGNAAGDGATTMPP
jgi:hypothetical protein